MQFIQDWEPVLYGLAILAGAGIVGYLLNLLVFFILKRLAKRTSTVLDDALVKHTRRSLMYLMILLVINLALPLVNLPENISYIVHSLFRVLFIFSVAWLIIGLALVGEDVILSHYDMQTKDNLKARAVYTQVSTIRKVLTAVVIVIAVSLVLLGFETFRQIGTGILASAGLASLIIGLAAQKIVGNFLAGVQIAFTQPIRIDDVVIVENEWGRIEEITLTYVVVRIWDLRRLILPISYFIEKPFQNWTRVSADILGTVFLYTDYIVPVSEIRQELERILKSSGKWDGKVAGVQVTGSGEKTLELRALMSAADASLAWDLRCEVREKLVQFIRTHYPAALPRTRAILEKEPDAFQTAV